MSDTTYVKNYDIGTATLDLPDFFYNHRIDFTSLKDDYIELPVGLVYTSRGRRCESDTRFYGKNLFGIVPGLKLTIQKRHMLITEARCVENTRKTFSPTATAPAPTG